MTKIEAIQHLSACKPLYQRMISVVRYQLTDEDLSCLKNFKIVYESTWFDDPEVIEASGVTFDQQAFLLGRVIMLGL